MAIGFVPFTLQGTNITNPTSIEFGEDGRLYVSQQNGLIKAHTIQQTQVNGNPVYTVTAVETIDAVQTIKNHNDDGSKAPGVTTRQVTGIATSSETTPEGTAVVIYVGSSDPRISVGTDSGLDTNSGTISKLVQVLDSNGVPTGDWEMTHLVRGLPRSEENHSLNGIQIVRDANGNDVELMVVIGGNTNNGGPSNNFSGAPEYAYNNAILRVDLQALESIDSRVDPEGQTYKLDLPTLDDPTRNFGGGADSNGTVSEVFGGNDGFNMAKIAATVDVPVGGVTQSIANPLQIYSPGYRNAYDVLVAESGKVYTIDNGPNAGWGGPTIAWGGDDQGTAPATQGDGSVVISGNVSGGNWQTLRPTNILNDAYGSSGFADQLHFVGDVGDTHGIYGGHANPIRASVTVDVDDFTDTEAASFLPDGVTPATATPAQMAAARSAAYTDFLGKLLINYNKQGDGTWADAGTPLPSDFQDLLDGYTWRGADGGPVLVTEDGHSIESALLNLANENELKTFENSTNGLAEWTFAGAFDGEWTGALVTVSFDNTITFMKLNAAGTQVVESQVINVLGNQPLDVTTQGAGEAFQGTMWTAQYGPDTIQIWVPNDGGTGEVPTDHDGDGADDEDDRFAGDASDATDAVLNNGATLEWSWEPTGDAPPGSPYEAPIDDIGFIGAFTNFVVPGHLKVFGGAGGTELIRDGMITAANWKFGGATGRVDVEVADDGSARTNSQREAPHIGFKVGSNTAEYTVDVPLRNILTYAANDSQTFTGGERAGFYVGTGDQDNYIHIVHGLVNFGSDANPNWQPGIEVAMEVAGAFSKQTYSVANLGAQNVNSLVQLQLTVNTVAGTVTPSWRVLPGESLPAPGSGPAFTVGTALQPSGSVLSALEGNYAPGGSASGVAVGLLATTNQGDDSFAASWDPITVTSQAITQRIEAEAFTRDVGFVVNNLGAASGGQVLKAGSSAEQRAHTVFDGISGTYDLTVGYFDENDGVAMLSVVVDGVIVDTWQWNQNLGSANAVASTRATHVIQDVSLAPGSVIEFVGFQNAAEPLRVDYLDTTYVGAPTQGDSTPPTVQSVTVADITTGGAGSHSITVTFADNVALETSSFNPADVTITGPGGALTVVSAQVNDPADGNPRTVTYVVNAPGGSWNAADNGTYTVALNGNQVFDTSNNAAAANANIGDFVVNVSGGGSITRVEAEAFTINTGFVVSSLGVASGDQVLKAGSSAEQRASHTFAGTDGLYELKVGYFDENDGVATLSVVVDGVTIDTWQWNQNFGTPNATGTSRTVHTIQDVAITSGDVVQLVGFSNAGEPLRTDYVDFTRTGDLPGGDTTPPTVQNVTVADIASGGATTHTITVTFADNVALETSSFNPADVTITGPGGALTVASAQVNNPADGTPRTVTYTVNAPGGSWNDADNGTYTVALNGNQVFDTSDNAAAADPSLADFDVDIGGTPANVGALLTVKFPNTLDSSTYGASSFRVTNTGAAAITAIEIDLSTVSLTSPGSRIVFDPAGEAGDSQAKAFSLDTIFTDTGSAFSVTGVLYDGDPDYTDDGLARQQQGYEKLTVLLSGFDAGDQFRFSIDVDPTSIGGVPSAGQGGAGSINGAELSGAVFSATSGSTTASSVLLARGVQSNQGAGASGEGSADSRAIVNLQGPVSLSVEGVTNGGQLTSADEDPLVTLSGPANATVRLVVLEGDVAGTGVTIDPADFELDTVRSVQSYLVQLNASGQGSQLIDVARDTLATDGQSPTFVVQATLVSTLSGYGAVATGQTSDGLRVRYDPGLASLSAPESSFRYEAEDFDSLVGFSAQSNPNASGSGNRDATTLDEAAAGRIFDGPSGTYDPCVGYFDKSDGVATASALINGVVVDRWQGDQDLGSALADAVSLTFREITNMSIENGDLIEFRGFADGLPGDAAEEPLRFDYVDFVPGFDLI